jgi:hypothetical protein
MPIVKRAVAVMNQTMPRAGGVEVDASGERGCDQHRNL